MTYVYFDLQVGIFIFASRKKDNQRYVRLPDIELRALAERNVLSVKRHIIKNNKVNSFFYHSLKEIDKIEIPHSTVHEKSLYNKPSGLWISCGTDWLDYVYENHKAPHKYNLFSFTYEIELFDNVKVISDKEQLLQFIKKYKKKPEHIRVYDVMDWEKVKQEYAGLVITPHLGTRLWHEPRNKMYIEGAEAVHDFFVDLLGQGWKNKALLLCEWYRAWESASGVIWNREGIASFKLIKKTNFKRYLT